MSKLPITIREFRENDLEAVENLAVEIQDYERSVDSLRTKGELIKKEHVADLLDSIKNGKGVLLIAEVENQSVGYILARIETDRMDIFERMYIADLGITPRFRGLGIGSKLIHAIEELAKTKFKVEYVMIGVLSANTEAHRLYHKLGYLDREVTLLKKLSS